MPPFLRFLASHPELIYIALAVGLPVMGKVIKSVKDRRAETERRRLMQRAEMEALRTGRTGATAEYAPPQQPRPPAPTAPQNMPTEPTPAPQTSTRVGQPRYVQLPGGVILELPPAPTGPVPNQGGAPRPPAPRPSAPRPTAPRPASPRPTPARQTPARQQRATQRPAAPRTPAQRPQLPQQQTSQQRAQQTAARQASENQLRAERMLRDREEREAEERRRQAEERQRLAREEQQRKQTEKIVADAYRQDAPGTERAPNTVMVGGMKLKTRDLRRVLLLREIMDPPVSMRDELPARDPII